MEVCWSPLRWSVEMMRREDSPEPETDCMTSKDWMSLRPRFQRTFAGTYTACDWFEADGNVAERTAAPLLSPTDPRTRTVITVLLLARRLEDCAAHS